MGNVQNHIHLSTTLTGSPEFAPDIKWKIKDRKQTPAFYGELVPSLFGTRYAHVIKNGDNPVVYLDYSYEMYLINDTDSTAIEKLNVLIGLLGRELYLVDTIHCDNGEDHTPFVHNAWFAEIGDVPTNQLLLDFFYVPIKIASLDAL